MRWLGLLVLAGCGRLGFDPAATDAQERPDILPIDVIPLDGSVPSGLVAWYPLDDTANNTADVAGGVNGTCGTVQGCPTQTVGHHGGAFLFDAANDCIEIPDLGQALFQQYTLSIWGRIDAPDACSAFSKRVDVSGTTLDSWQIYTSSTNQITFAGNNGSTTQSKVQTPDNVLIIGTWHHFAATVDGATRILYYDGTNIGSSAWTTTNYDTHSMWVGCDDQGGGLWSQHWQGALDDFQIYNRALSPSEIAALAAQ